MIKLDLSIDEVNTILRVLGKHPFEEVVSLVSKIKQQGDPQAEEIAKQLEEAALTDPYFIERKLFPNVDFYSGIIYRAMGFPTDFFTVLFSLGRLPGWISQWQEMRKEKQPIARPRQIYTGETIRPFVAMKDRS